MAKPLEKRAKRSAPGSTQNAASRHQQLKSEAAVAIQNKGSDNAVFHDNGGDNGAPGGSADDAELAYMMKAGLIDEDDLLPKKLRKAKHRKLLKKNASGDYWDNLGDWKSVDPGDDILLGAEEGGFAGLEILEDPVILNEAMFSAGNLEDTDNQQHKQPSTKKAKAKKEPVAGVKRKAASQAGDANGDAAAAVPVKQQVAASKDSKVQDVSTLMSRLAALEQENALLKKKQGMSKGEKQRSKKQQLREQGQAAAGALPEGASGAAGAAAAVGEVAEQKLSGRAKKEAMRQRMVEKRQARKEAKAAARQMQEAGVVAEPQAAGQHQESQLADVASWKGFALHPSIERALALQGFEQPTEIQSLCLPAAIRDRLDIIGAAQTGSGKTLAFGLPILQVLMQEREVLEAAGQEDPHQGKLRALVLTPTRELALQVCEHMQAVGKVCGIRVIAIVGGLAQVKQERLLAAHPQVVVATPGRLWELMRAGQAQLSDLSRLSFLVLDEADRMVQQGHFQELSSILDMVPKPGEVKQDTYDDEFEEAFKEDTQRGQAAKKPGKGKHAGKAQQAEEQQQLNAREGDGEEAVEAAAAGKGEEGMEEEDVQRGQGHASSSGAGAAGLRSSRHLLQTFVFSATLTLPADLRRRLRRGGGGSSGAASLESLMDRIVFRGEPRIVDLTTTTRLAAKVDEAYLQCTDEERDEILYYLLARHPGRTLVFVNAISAVRRLAAILKILGLPAHALHAQQQQRQRLKAVDRFKAHPQAILVASDVAARGLDIKGVRCVIHYQLPASTDTYIHRSGRTARAGEDGISIALVTPREAPRWAALTRDMARPEPLPSFPVDRTLMPQVHTRLKMAMKLDDMLRAERKQRAEKSWARTNAEALGIDVSDSELPGEGSDDEDGGSQKAIGAAAKALQAQLAELLATPLTPKMSTRFFTGGAAARVAHGAGLKATTAAADAHSVVPTETVNKAVSLANQLQQSKDSVKAQQEAKKQRHRAAAAEPGASVEGQQGGPPAAAEAAEAPQVEGGDEPGHTQGKPRAKQQKRKAKPQQQRWRSPAELARELLNKSQMKKKQKRSMVVIPAAFGRDAQGADALQALRAKLALIK